MVRVDGEPISKLSILRNRIGGFVPGLKKGEYIARNDNGVPHKSGEDYFIDLIELKKAQWGQWMTGPVKELQAGYIQTRIDFLTPENGGSAAFYRESVLERYILAFFERLKKIGSYSGETDIDNDTFINSIVFFIICLDLDRHGKVEAWTCSLFRVVVYHRDIPFLTGILAALPPYISTLFLSCQ